MADLVLHNKGKRKVTPVKAEKFSLLHLFPQAQKKLCVIE
jgi:hypothetical protein